jgi:radical SAM superfamily enzyme YgiQ (UPF0313 family)
VVTDRGESLPAVLAEILGDAYPAPSHAPGFPVGAGVNLDDPDSLPYPGFDLQRCINYVPLLTCRGCPFNCAYCASNLLEPALVRLSTRRVLAEIDHWQNAFGVDDFVFYDDALLVDAQQHALPLFEALAGRERRLRLHTPNALHLRYISAECARLMYRAGFETLRLGLETAAFSSRSGLDRKVTEQEFGQAVKHLLDAGFRPDQIGAYLLVGLPGQRIAAVQESIQVVKQSGITPVLAHYSPISGTRLWGAAVAASRYDLESDPIFSNNAISPCSAEAFSWQTLTALKEQARC